MMTQVGKIEQDKLVVTNVGSTTITYDWKKYLRGDYIPSKNSDMAQRFYCHYPKSILKPGESKIFTFSFRSERPGMYQEEWELLTEPLLLNALPLINLSGISTQGDSFIDVREQFEVKFNEEITAQNANEVFEEIFDRVKTPTPPAPIMTEPDTFKHFFEKNNRHLGLYYTKYIMDSFF